MKGCSFTCHSPHIRKEQTRSFRYGCTNGSGNTSMAWGSLSNISCGGTKMVKHKSLFVYRKTKWKNSFLNRIRRKRLKEAISDINTKGILFIVQLKSGEFKILDILLIYIYLKATNVLFEGICQMVMLMRKFYVFIFLKI